ncbi:MAG: Panacea domain-containing protein [Pyrinomonadaceae bacterium]
MNGDELSTAGLLAKVRAIVGRVQMAFRQETGEHYDPQLVEDSLIECVANELGRLEEGMLEMFTTPGRRQYLELASILERDNAVAKAAVAVQEEAYLAKEFNDESVFEGFRPFSKPKMAAMIEHLTAKGHNVYKTSLNKLLFYSDLSMFYLAGHGISGATYANRPYGPVSANAEPILNELVAEDRVRVDPRLKTLQASGEASADILAGDEKKVLDWVAETYGGMKASEISDHSHAEMAYKYTEPNEPIAYAYGKFLKRLPPKDLLDR